jgi:hypothetical protein
MNNKIKPILFSTPMIEAILDNRKTMTRRLVKDPLKSNGSAPIQVGDILWVRESFCITQPSDPEKYFFGYKTGDHSKNQASEKYDYAIPNVWKPSIHMPKEACRIFLEITNIRAERLQDISDSDAYAEGIKVIEDYYWDKGALNYMYGEEYSYSREYFFLDGNYGIKGMPDHNGIKASFFSLWASINKWESVILNPMVWVYEFKQVEKPTNF